MKPLYTGGYLMPTDIRDMKLHCDKAMQNGGRRKSLMSFEWDIAPRCESPVNVDLFARPPGKDGEKYVTVEPGKANPLALEITAPCRKCSNCLKLRAALWTFRARAETRLASRTWFGTLTLSPDNHFMVLARVRARLEASGTRFEELAPDEQTAMRIVGAATEVTKYLKRVRKNSGERFRYLLVAEAHKSGLPHFHLLLHEQGGFVRHKTLTEGWKLGFSQWKLATDADNVSYLCKYLAKTNLARVRASLSYGDGNPQGVANPGGLAWGGLPPRRCAAAANDNGEARKDMDCS